MAQLELNEKETALLSEILEGCLSDLKTERVRTDKREMHQHFLERENFVADLLVRLQRRG